MSLKFFAFIGLFISQVASAQSFHLAVLGGGGEPKRTTTIFDEPLALVGQFSKNNPGIKTAVAFNGGHSETEKISQEKFGVNRPFTAQNYNQMIDDYMQKINSGEIKAGDKILMYIHTHGATKSSIEKTHGIATSGNVVTNFNNFSGPSVVSVDNLKRVVDLATKKGIKLGIIDLSCHSGNTLALANANTCVISGTGPNHYAGAGSSSFGTILSRELKRGKSLEDIYMAAREDFSDTSFPMISTPQGNDVQLRLYNALTPYLYYYHPAADKFTPFMEKISSQDKCELDDGIQNLMKEADMVLNATSDAATKLAIQKFKKAVKDYYDFMSNLRTQMRSVGYSELSKSHRFCSDGNCVDYTVKQLMTMNFDGIMNFFNGQANSSSGSSRRTNLASAENVRQAKIKYAEILAANPKLNKAKDFWGSLKNLTTQTSVYQSAVSSAQQELYRDLYRRSNASGPNPCRDFVL